MGQNTRGSIMYSYLDLQSNQLVLGLLRAKLGTVGNG